MTKWYGFDENEAVDIVIRPEDIQIVGAEDGDLRGLVVSSLFKGVHYEIVVKTLQRDYIVHTTTNVELDVEVGITFTPEDIHVMYTLESY